MAKPELGVKRTCPETGRKFYDLNKDPVVSPFTGKAYPAASFEPVAKPSRGIVEKVAPKKAVVNEDDETAEAEDVDTISLEDADEETTGGKTDADADGDDDDDKDVDENFLEPDDADDDVTEIIGDREKDDDT